LAKNQKARQPEPEPAEVVAEKMAKQMGLPWPPRDVFKELDELSARVAALEKK
jgi:hypothetical protein